MAYMKEKGLMKVPFTWNAAKPTGACSRVDGAEFHQARRHQHRDLPGSENIFIPMLHHEYSDTATIATRNVPRGQGLQFLSASAIIAAFLEEVKKFPFEVLPKREIGRPFLERVTEGKSAKRVCSWCAGRAKAAFPLPVIRGLGCHSESL